MGKWWNRTYQQAASNARTLIQLAPHFYIWIPLKLLSSLRTTVNHYEVVVSHPKKGTGC